MMLHKTTQSNDEQDEKKISTSLHVAVLSGKLEDVKKLLELDADTETVDENGKTPLYLAAERGFSKIVSILLENGSNVNFQNEGIALHYLDPNSKTLHDLSSKSTALHAAARHLHMETVKILLLREANLTIQDRFGDTALHIVICNLERLGIRGNHRLFDRLKMLDLLTKVLIIQGYESIIDNVENTERKTIKYYLNIVEKNNQLPEKVNSKEFNDDSSITSSQEALDTLYSGDQEATYESLNTEWVQKNQENLKKQALDADIKRATRSLNRPITSKEIDSVASKYLKNLKELCNEILAKEKRVFSRFTP